MVAKSNGSASETAKGAGGERRFKGVRRRSWGKWVSEIRLPNTRARLWLGSYATADQAARAFDVAVVCLRGRSAALNFPESAPSYAPLGLPYDQIQELAAAAAYASFSSAIVDPCCDQAMPLPSSSEPLPSSSDMSTSETSTSSGQSERSSVASTLHVESAATFDEEPPGLATSDEERAGSKEQQDCWEDWFKELVVECDWDIEALWGASGALDCCVTTCAAPLLVDRYDNEEVLGSSMADPHGLWSLH